MVATTVAGNATIRNAARQRPLEEPYERVSVLLRYNLAFSSWEQIFKTE
jgi:hypothetical protein